jgi:hypothetical protein
MHGGGVETERIQATDGARIVTINSKVYVCVAMVSSNVELEFFVRATFLISNHE